ncbi:MAG: glycosyltransferase family 1 protein [Nitratireductor sp.]|nr:glycosyltransferase family 1 protein [Nitratireductor sp.]
MRILIITDAWFPQVNGVVRTLDHLKRELEKQGHDLMFITPDMFLSLPMPSYPEIRLSLTLTACVKRHIREFGPDTVHIATEGPLGITGSRACRGLGLSYTTSYHTRFPEYLRARVPVPVDWSYAWLRRFHNSGVGCLVATQTVEDDLAARGFKNLIRWTRGVDHEQFNPSRRNMEWLSSYPRPFFVNVGRVAIEKNLDAFLDLDLPGTKIVVGDGPDLARLKREYPQAVFVGEKHGEELAEAYASSDVMVFPSLTDTFGNVITESLACGTPVAGFPVTGPIDILSGTKAGICDADLGRACLAALELDRDDAATEARKYTWERCAEIFLEAQQANLEQTEERAGVPAA